MEHVGDLDCFEHIRCVPVSAKAYPYAFFHHFQDRRNPDSITHIGFGIMHNVHIAPLEDIHFSLIYVYAVTCDGFRAQDSEGVQPFNNALAGFLERVFQVLRPFGYMDVEAHVKAFRCFFALLQRIIRKSNLRMQSERTLKERTIILPASLDEPYILFDTLIPDFKAVSV